MLASIGVIDYWAFLLGTIGIILLPGPNSLFVLATAAQSGVKKGYQAAVGVFCGDAILMLLSVLGVSSLLKIESIFLIVKVGGAGYLFYLGVMLLKGAWQKIRQAPTTETEQKLAVPSAKSSFRKALLLSLSNPKAILFFVAFFLQFVHPAFAKTWLPFLILGLTVQVTSFIYLTFLIFTGASLATWFYKRQRLAAVGTASVGLLFVAFGIKLVTAHID